MAKLCLSLTAKTLAKNLTLLDKYRKHVDIAELRVDCLEPDERFLIRRFPEKAGLPVILTMRRTIDGGEYSGSESARIVLLSRGLAFPEKDQRRNFGFVELEEDINAPSLMEVARAFGTKIIRSCYNLLNTEDNICKKIKSLQHIGDEISKIAVTPQSLDEFTGVYKAACTASDTDKIIVCYGKYGLNTQILADQLGSFLCYANIKKEDDARAAYPGLLDPEELEESYRFSCITKKTQKFIVTGYPLKTTVSPWFFNRVFNIEKIDAVYFPVPADSLDSLMQLTKYIEAAGMSVTFPYKEASLNFLSFQSDKVKTIGACDTMVSDKPGWKGFNCDAKGFMDTILAAVGAKNLKGKKVTIAGAGGAARAVAAVVSELKGKALILNRTATKAHTLAMPYNFLWGGLNSQGFKMMKKFSDIIIQATSLGMEDGSNADPLDFYQFTGKELVIDLICRNEKTCCLKRAEEAGCKTYDGYYILLRKVRYQYEYFLGKEFPPSLINRVGLQEQG